MQTPYEAFIAFGRGNMNEFRTLLQRALAILKEAKMDAGPDDQFEINWLSAYLESN